MSIALAFDVPFDASLLTAVSYTHLDVYKRQLLALRSKIMRLYQIQVWQLIFVQQLPVVKDTLLI